MSLSSSLLWRGLLAIAVGIVSVIWPNITVSAFVILFAVYAFIAAGTDVMRAFSSKRAGPVAGYLLLAVLSLAAGIGALVWPGVTALVLVIWIGAWALVTGVVEVAMAFPQARPPAPAPCGRWAASSRSRWVWCCSFTRTSARQRWPPSSDCSASSTGCPPWCCPSRPATPSRPPGGCSAPPIDRLRYEETGPHGPVSWVSGATGAARREGVQRHRTNQILATSSSTAWRR
jgi:Short repeat of unknown function (DUF308)